MHGVGLGLFVAEGLVRAAGGRIMAENAADAVSDLTPSMNFGATFVVQLPAVAAGAGVPARPAHNSA